MIRRTRYLRWSCLVALVLWLSPSGPTAQTRTGWEWEGVPRVVALGDVHGRYTELEESIADIVVAGLASNAMTVVGFSKRFGDVDLTECVNKLHAAVSRVHGGDLREAETFLTAQAVTLNTMFTHLAGMAAKTEYVDHLDRYMRLALKAQGQCRATLETLATIKNPPVVLARQANIAQGPQQVNNTVSLERRNDQPTRAAKPKNRENQTIDVEGT